MFRRFSVNFALFSIFFDGFLVALALFSSTYLREAFNHLSILKDIPLTQLPLELYLIFPGLWVGILLILSVYDGRRNFRVASELGNVTLGSTLAAVSLAGVLYLTYRDVSRALFGIFVLLAFLLLITWRIVARVAFRWQLTNGTHCRKVLIAGSSDWGRRLQAQIRSDPGLGLALAGFLDDDPQKRAAQPDIIGGLGDARSLITRLEVEDVVIALPRSAHKALNRLVAELHDLPVKVWVIPDYYSLALQRAAVSEFAGIPMFDLRAPVLDEYQRMVKRAFDLVMTGITLPPALWIMGVVAVAIKLDSPGPVFYRQKRVGENGRLFEMIKFRSMVANADALRHLVEETGPDGRLTQRKRADDPRVTRVGAFLRRTSLDELPQLFNVLRGDMSLIGPRPEMPHLVDKYELWQRKRFAVPQGMTGWWQVNGRSDKPMHQHTEEDLYYVQHYSLWLDLQILVKTVWVVLRGKGAY